jgi:hypothetical protein
MIWRIVLITALALAMVQPVNAYQFEDGTVEVAFATKSISAAVTEGGNARGPALAVM